MGYRVYKKVILLDVIGQMFRIEHELISDKKEYRDLKASVELGVVSNMIQKAEEMDFDCEILGNKIWEAYASWMKPLGNSRGVYADPVFLKGLAQHYLVEDFGHRIIWSFREDRFLLDSRTPSSHFCMDGVIEPHRYFWDYLLNESRRENKLMY